MNEETTVFVVRGPPWASIKGVFSSLKKAMYFIGPDCEKDGLGDYDIWEEPLDPPGSLNFGDNWDDDK